MLSLSTLANCSGTISLSVASPSPSRVKAVRCGRAASKRIGADGLGRMLYTIERVERRGNATGSGGLT